jgi:hypothetical protein
MRRFAAKTRVVLAGWLGVVALTSAELAAQTVPSYRIHHQEVVDQPTHSKLKQYVVVEKGTDEKSLRALLTELRTRGRGRRWKASGEPGVWIWVFDADRSAASAPDQWIAMLANPSGQEAVVTIASTVTATPPTTPKRSKKSLGSWRYVSGGMHWVDTLYHDGSSWRLHVAYHDGSESDDAVVESTHPDGRKFADPADAHGEYVVVLSDGTLGLYGRSGRFATLPPVQ